MSKILTLSIITFLLFSCSSDNSEVQKEETLDLELAKGPNSSKINLAIGIKDNADLSVVFKTINELNFDIRQMNGFVYLSNTAKSDVPDLRDFLNTKPYIKTGAWQATTSSVFYYEPENKTYIVNSFFEMNLSNQEDLLGIISSLKLQEKDKGNICLSIPEGTQTYWKTAMKKYSFVEWTETFDQVCVSYEQAPVIVANVPSIGKVNEIIPIDITFSTRNSCGGFDSVSETNSGNTKTITIKAKYEGCFCFQSIGNIKTIYNFKATTTGTHILRFPQPNGGLLTYSINIQ
ncbi:hypothetical protein [Flavobacterium sp. 245]|uniref:hypothetical protein n=1 Tax=Flavobacterium sp. 245 TaxID=2512115 RepID=UPI00105C910D|nr:hypothetical protein [Flavobacterium sp. 245]TDO99268.1 hypothetical protein EV145_107176 [Flavobacterium sp. 245]